MAKLTPDEVRAIRAAHVKNDFRVGSKALARKYGKSDSIIRKIISGQLYGWVPVDPPPPSDLQLIVAQIVEASQALSERENQIGKLHQALGSLIAAINDPSRTDNLATSPELIAAVALHRSLSNVEH